MIDLYSKVITQYEQNLPFVIYNKPNNKKIIGIFQENDHLYYAKSFNEAGFIMAAFDSNTSPILIPADKSEVIIEKFKKNNSKLDKSSVEKTQNEGAKNAFEALVSKAIKDIEGGFFNKVVLSRKELVDIPDFDLIQLFEKLLNSYASAFTYCWFHPKVGLWMGATPEQLLKAKGDHFKTVALAGTQKYRDTEEVLWENKEKEEQQFVTDFILDNLKGVTTEILVSSPYTTRAGSLLHLKTDIRGTLNPSFSLKQVLDILHPTPAVCGLPKIIAKDFILEHEGYDRTFYTGFLGELNKCFGNGKNNTDLYVNLRCMSIKDSQATLFIGGGINKGSVPEKEWIETVNKSMIMKKIIN
ncbi:isochorismate synthase [Flavobacterium sp. '19STA2R22 D10 B1']|uniref:isochorismate synthase n=1 Tax=Flavobacterium aerium TaxID=3037261 RepID=UPI00278C6D68|nr:isochorismate synthase [Flavobacterium sp. '19STA2R22 D10 B1']